MSLRDDAVAIWNSGVAAVDSAQAVRRHVDINDGCLILADVRIPLTGTQRIEVVGAGKAGAGMASGIESALRNTNLEDRVSGWVNVPADCVHPRAVEKWDRHLTESANIITSMIPGSEPVPFFYGLPLNQIHLHAARPAGLNEPTAEAVRGTEEILRRVRSLAKSDVCIVLLSGGASALLCCPTPGISLDDKLSVTRALAGAGAPIQELNLVRTQLSQVKGGKLAAACNADTLVALIISDVIGDPLEVIGSGPTTPITSHATNALRILRDRDLLNSIPPSVISFLQQRATVPSISKTALPCTAVNYIVASNAIAIHAATKKAASLGYTVESRGSANAGEAADEGRRLMNQLRAHRSEWDSASQRGATDRQRRVCVLSGGEPTVNLKSDSDVRDLQSSPPRGGRNQELVLAAIAAHQDPAEWHNVALLSGGTDGEDGPTDAAGAIADESLLLKISASGLSPNDYLSRHDSYAFFDAVSGLFKTGPTHTNVMDLRVGLVVS
ncbi:MAG TPA: DUF4147 domain-containing protein [Planctomycetaceae bacterium]|nr:DUF4147 domain-containing protein [Planctomycetaceae bacterium]HQZ64971.1 DUF4147 domain-containing protein [Planctomycetaceae bacterium]HRA87598.1 DUF4147 domain-containing protein [Planctomycetaceae bacterium]